MRRYSTPSKARLARELRANPSATEAALWQLLRRRQVLGFRFHRRAIVLGRIPDFWCPEAKLAVEIDGAGGEEKAARDADRDQLFTEHGILTVHVSSDLVWRDRAAATGLIEDALRSRNRAGASKTANAPA